MRVLIYKYLKSAMPMHILLIAAIFFVQANIKPSKIIRVTNEIKLFK